MKWRTGNPAPRSYVIRIYRQSARTLVGQIEDVETGEIRPFHSIVDLWRLLGGRGGLIRSGTGNAP